MGGLGDNMNKLVFLLIVLVVIVIVGCSQVERCENQPTASKKDRCYWEEATAKQDISLCNRISEDLDTMKQMCIWDVHDGKRSPSG